MANRGNTALTITDSSTTRYQLGAWDLSDLLPDAADERVADLLRVDRAAGGGARVEARLARRDHRAGAARDRSPLRGGHRGDDGAGRLRQPAVLGQHPGREPRSRCATASITTSRCSATASSSSRCGGRGCPRSARWHSLPDPAADPDAAFFLLDQRRLSAYALDERAEQIINTKDTDGIGGVLTVFSMLTNRLTFKRRGRRRGARAHPRRAGVVLPLARRRAARARLPGARPRAAARVQGARPDLRPPRARLVQRAGEAARLRVADRGAQPRRTTSPIARSPLCST